MMTMIKAWRPVLEDINAEISRLHASLADLTFDSDFPNRMNIMKIRIQELLQRIEATKWEMKADAAAKREMIDACMSEFRAEAKATIAALFALKTFRAERSRANYLHIQQLHQERNEEGGEA